MTKFILAHDTGTTGNKATLYTPDGEAVGVAFGPYDTRYPRTGWAEQNPHDWWQAICQTTRKILEDTKINSTDIACVVFSGQMMGCVFVDQRGNVLREAIIWADMRAEREARELLDKVGMDRVYRLTGHRISSSYSGAKIRWVQNNQPDIYSQTHKVLHAKDYLAFRLTGVFATDYTDAAGMNLFDIVKKEWSAEILDAWSIARDKLPNPYPSTEVIGEVTREAASETGLAPGTPVVIGGGDGSCAGVGVGVIHEGEAFNYIGSSSWIGLATSEPIFDPDMKTYNWIHLDSNKFSPNGTMQAGGASYQWIRDQLFSSEKISNASVYEVMNQYAAQSPVGSNGLFFLPYLMGERSPRWNPDARGTYVGLHITHSRAEMVRAVIEGVAYNLKIILDTFRGSGVDIKSLWVLGGAAKGGVWRQILADVYGVDVMVPHLLDEATSMGAAVAGGVGVGLLKDFSEVKQWVRLTELVHPSDTNHAKYQSLFETFQLAYEQLLPVYERIATHTGN